MCIATLDATAIKNACARARWRAKWHERGGSGAWPARDLPDLRNKDERSRGRALAFDVFIARRYLRSQTIYFGRATVRAAS